MYTLHTYITENINKHQHYTFHSHPDDENKRESKCEYVYAK